MQVDDVLEQKIEHVLEHVRDLNHVLSGLNKNRDKLQPTERLVGCLVQLVERGLCALNAFELLLRVDSDAAMDVLLRRYLGDGVNPDMRSGGYESDLGVMLSDLVATCGEKPLRDLVETGRIPPERLSDQRVVRALQDALSEDGPTL